MDHFGATRNYGKGKLEVYLKMNFYIYFNNLMYTTDFLTLLTWTLSIIVDNILMLNC